MHKGTYADDCIVSRVMQHRCYIVATNDQALRRRIRKIPGRTLYDVFDFRRTNHVCGTRAIQGRKVANRVGVELVNENSRDSRMSTPSKLHYEICLLILSVQLVPPILGTLRPNCVGTPLIRWNALRFYTESNKETEGTLCRRI